jgi:SRSO17 transposase
MEPVSVREVTGWTTELGRLHDRIGRRFFRREPRRRALGYLRGLLSGADRKNGWQLAEQVGEATPDGVQRLLATARWDADGVRDDFRAYVLEHLGDPDGVLVVDETSVIKKGTKSVGVQRQYCGTVGRIANCQVAVFLAYATRHGRAFLDRELYLPKGWADDPARRREAGVPPRVRFATKPALARRMLERALNAGVPAAWVAGDEVYGGERRLRQWLEQRKQPFVLTVSSREPLWVDRPGVGPSQVSAARIRATIPTEAWQQLSAGDGTKGPRVYDWARVRLARWPERDREHWLLVRRSLTDRTPRGYAYFVVYAPTGTELPTLARVAGARWAIEECFEAAKGEIGLDHYEVRRWESWYRHVTLALLAHAFLTVTRAEAANRRRSGGRPGAGRGADPADRARGEAIAPASGVGDRTAHRARPRLVHVATATPSQGQALPLRATLR